MGEKELPFPYEFEEMKPEEDEFINTDFGMPIKFIRLGPKGFIVFKTYSKDAANIYNMSLRPTDVFVATYQRSGTTWTQELVWLIANDLNYEKAAERPLTRRYQFLSTQASMVPKLPKRTLLSPVPVPKGPKKISFSLNAYNEKSFN